MRKIFVLLAMLAVVLPGSAQGMWKKSVTEADELKGVSAMTVYEWNGDGCTFTMNGGNNEWSVSGVPFKPDPTHVNHRNNFETFATIGFYDESDKLVEKYDKCRLELTDFYRRATSLSGRKKKGQYAVSDYLMTGNGYVRVIIPTIQGDDFDVIIPCMSR